MYIIMLMRLKNIILSAIPSNLNKIFIINYLELSILTLPSISSLQPYIEITNKINLLLKNQKNISLIIAYFLQHFPIKFLDNIMQMIDISHLNIKLNAINFFINTLYLYSNNYLIGTFVLIFFVYFYYFYPLFLIFQFSINTIK
jgi:hypothetical protein